MLSIVPFIHVHVLKQGLDMVRYKGIDALSRRTCTHMYHPHFYM